jgi:flagellar M-ring protein FliF
LSVAVILDHKTVYSKEKDGKVISRSEPRSEKDISAYRELVLAAIGYDPKRGDVVTIENVAFYSESKPEEQQPAMPWYVKWHSQPYLMPLIKYGFFILLFLLVYLVLFRPIRKRVFQAISVAALGPGKSGEAQLMSEEARRALPETRQPEEIASSATPGAQANLPAAESHEDIMSLETVSDEQIERELIKEANTVEKGGRKFAAMKKKLIDKAKKDPEMVSQLIRTLLREKA